MQAEALQVLFIATNIVVTFTMETEESFYFLSYSVLFGWLICETFLVFIFAL